MTSTSRPTDTDLASFREVGFFIAPELFTAAECDAVLVHIEQAAFEVALGEANDGPLSYRPMMHLTSPELTGAATDRRWAPLVVPLIGTGDARLYWEQAVAKPPQARTELPWHQDNGYTPLLPQEYLTCWLALDDADEANGCLWVIPGSHRQGTLRHVNGGSGPFRVGHDGPAGDGVAVPVRRGSGLVFSSLLMHRSGPNTTRRAPTSLDNPVLPGRGALRAVRAPPRRPTPARRGRHLARRAYAPARVRPRRRAGQLRPAVKHHPAAIAIVGFAAVQLALAVRAPAPPIVITIDTRATKGTVDRHLIGAGGAPALRPSTRPTSPTKPAAITPDSRGSVPGVTRGQLFRGPFPPKKHLISPWSNR